MTDLKNRYIGIDLGTTNSCIAWGGFNAYSQKIVPEVIPIRMAGVPTAQEIIPSVVMYKTGEKCPTGIGLSAKQQFMQGSGDVETIVIRSVKLQMGREKVAEAPWLTPEHVSADILSVLKEGSERKLGDLQTNVVIGVPACFDVDMWNATEKAAKIAGFTDVRLVDEPKAALLDFIQSQDQLAPKDRVLDFDRPKIVCVFDPGGGTVDVSIVRVQQVPVTRGGRTLYEMKYDDLGLTRQPFLGGDDFDRLLADFLKNKFALQTGVRLDELPDVVYKSHAHGKILEYAEDAKKSLSDQVMDLVSFRRISEEDAIDQAFHDITISYIYKTYGLNYRLTYREYADIVSSLLGWSFRFEDIENLDVQRKLAYQEALRKSDNIIFPIYDAMMKARNRLGRTPNIDVVLVSGGMSKLQILRHRLRDFFGKSTPIIDVPSPDLSVARGAVLHHYNLVHGLDRTSNLLPEAISLEVGGSFVQLVPANIEYPTTQPIIPKGFQLIIPGSGIPYIDVPLWRGEPPQPTAKLIDRRIDLRDKAHILQKGDIVDIQVTIDANRHLRLEAWLQRNPYIRFEVTTVMA